MPVFCILMGKDFMPHSDERRANMTDNNVSHNNQKKIAAINDYSGFGRCSIAVELPVISAMKIQCCPMPTSIFSNHTGFDSFYFKDFTENMPPYMAEWKKLNLKFDGIVTGFLGSHNQIAIVEEFSRISRPKIILLLSTRLWVITEICIRHILMRYARR